MPDRPWQPQMKRIVCTLFDEHGSYGRFEISREELHASTETQLGSLLWDKALRVAQEYATRARAKNNKVARNA